MKSSDIIKYRLENQCISGKRFKKPEDVVRWLGAVQSQDYIGGLWAVALRTEGATKEDVEKAIADRKIVRTWPMRGTLHFVAAEDIRWMLQLSTPRVISGSAGRWRQLGLDEETFSLARKLVKKALKGGKSLTRKEMYEMWDKGGVSTAKQRGLHLLWRMAQEGLTCFGPHQGKQATFVLLDEWIPESKVFDKREDALAEYARRYFTSHGPATIQDFVWWSGLKVSDIKIGIEACGSALVEETIDGRIYWMGKDYKKTQDSSPTVYLLPPYDEYLVAYRDRSAAVDEDHYTKIFNLGNAIFSPVVVIDGKIEGSWGRTVKKDRIEITIKKFREFTKREEKALEITIDRYAEFWKTKILLTYLDA